METQHHTLVVGEEDWLAWCGHLDAHDERMAFGYCGRAATPEGDQYLLQAADLPGDPEYRFQGRVGVALKAECAVPRLVRARGRAAFVDVHSHPFTDRPVPSSTDEVGVRRQLQTLRDLAPGTALLRLIFGRAEAVWAEVFGPRADHPAPLHEIVVLGTARRRIVRPVNAPRRVPSPPAPHEARTRAVLPDADADLVRALRVAVIGAGGVGSAVVALLRGYVGDLALIDPDEVEAHNAPRLFGYAAGDEGTPKVAVQAREILRAFPETRVRALQEAFPTPRALALVKRADVVFACPDHNAIRYAAAQACARYLKPLVEVGCGGRRVEGRLAALGYHVRLQAPGGPCLACNGMAARDLEDPATTAMKRRIGYLDDGDLVRGELAPLTARAAADAVDLCLRYVTGYAGAAPRHLYVDALRMMTVDATDAYAANPACTLCGAARGTLRAAGDALGDDQRVLTPPREGGRDAALGA